jgi:ATP-dependent exoDNAse (exonuclease V) beta subunit
MLTISQPFKHLNLPKLADIPTQTVDGSRKYCVNGKLLPSITSVTSYQTRHSINEWRQRVGEEVANKISQFASTNGTKFHSIVEQYVDNSIDFAEYEGNENYEVALKLFKQFQPLLDDVNNIHYQESALYSETLGIAGRVDCIAEYQGKLSVIDFKSSSKPKYESQIQNYFVQETGYALMYEEMTGKKVEQIVTLISCHSGETQVFIKNPDDYVDTLKQYIVEYNNK